MRTLLWIAVLLVVVWVIARLIAGIASVLLNLLWIAALVLLVVWLIGKFRGGTTTGPTDRTV